jgi:hypothetical protein
MMRMSLGREYLRNIGAEPDRLELSTTTGKRKAIDLSVHAFE